MARTLQSIGANLSVMKGSIPKRISEDWNRIFRLTEAMASAHTLVSKCPIQRFFIKAGVPATNTAADSPGADICFIWDSTNSDWYLVYNWASSTSFTALKIIG